MAQLSALTEFALLARTPDEALDLEAVASAIARMGRDAVRAEAVGADLDTLADRIADEVPLGGAPDRVAAQLARAIHGTLGFHGDPAAFRAPEGSYLDAVIARRTGLPILLGVVWILLGRRLGVQVDGVNYPGRFYVSVGEPRGPVRVWVDPFAGGRQLPVEDLLRGLPPGAPRDVLGPAPVRTIAARMLTNLKHLWLDRAELEPALAATDRILLLVGERPQELRDRGVLAIHLGRRAEGERDLRRYLERVSDAPDRDAIRSLLRET